MRQKPKNLKKRLLLRLFVLTILIFILVGGLILQRSHQALYQALDTELQARLNSLMALTEFEKDGEIDFEFSDEPFGSYGDSSFAKYFLIKRVADGEILKMSKSLAMINFTIPGSARPPVARRPYFFNAEINGKKVRCLTTCIYPQIGEVSEREKINRDEVIGDIGDSSEFSDEAVQRKNELLYFVAIDRSATDNQFWQVTRLTVMSLGIGLVLLMLLGGVILTRSLAPLYTLERQVKSVSASHLVPVDVPDVAEVANVARALNQLIFNLKKALQRERQFTADVAHELRTPIAEIRTLTEVALSQKERISEIERKNYEDILASTKQMQHIVTNLLTLARYDAGALKCQTTKFDLAELVKKIWTQFIPSASSKNISAEYRVTSGMIIETDKYLLETMLHNLFSNATTYTPENGKIEWGVQSEDDNFTLFISNSPVSLTEQDLPHLTERFWQKESVRSPDTHHCGLGLSLVQALADILGFVLKFELTTPSTLTVSIMGRLSPE